MKGIAVLAGLVFCLIQGLSLAAPSPDLGTAEGWETQDGRNRLDLVVLLNTQHPKFKRDLNGVVVLGDGEKFLTVHLADYQLAVKADESPQKRFPTVADVLEKTLGGKYESQSGAQHYRLLQPTVVNALHEILKANQIRHPAAAMQWQTDPSPSGPLVLLLPRFVADNIRNGKSKSVPELTAVGARRLSGDLQALNAARYELIGVIEVSTLLKTASEIRKAASDNEAHAKQAQEQWFLRLDRAVAEQIEVVAAIAPNPTNTSQRSSTPTICTTQTADALAGKGLLASEAFVRWSGKKSGIGVDSVFKTPEDLFSAVQAGRCSIVLDYAPNIQRYVRALARDGKTVLLGPLMSRAEAQEPYARSMGFNNWPDFEFSRGLGKGGANGPQLAEFRKAGINDKASFNEALARMNQSGYDKTKEPSASQVLRFLSDEAAGKAIGQTALQFRTTAEAKAAAELKALEEAERQANERLAREFPFEAVISCGMGSHINLMACFAGGRRGVDTELKLTNGEQSGLFKAYNLNQSGGREGPDGYHLDLRERFSIRVQNANDTLILAVRITDRRTGKVVFQDQASKFGVISIRNP